MPVRLRTVVRRKTVTKKVRNKDQRSDLDFSSTENLIQTAILTWKDKVVCVSSISERPIETLEMELDSNLEFVEGDIKKSGINRIPSIEFSERVNQLLIKDMALTVVVKLLGRNIGLMTLQNRISNL